MTLRRGWIGIVFVLAVLGSGPGTAAAQGAEQPSAAAQGKVSADLAGIAHIALRVHDLDASVAFYAKLGFVEAFSLSKNGKVYEAFIKINDRQFIELYPATEANPQIGFLHLCFEGADLPAVHDFYVAHGLTPTAVKTAGAGNLLFTMRGPASPTGPQNMEYTQYMPGSLHEKDFGQHLGPDRVATRLLSVSLAMNDPDAAAAFYVRDAGFTVVKAHRLRLPGPSGEEVDLVPAQELGFRSRIELEVKDRKVAEKELKRRGVQFTRSGGELTLSDEDGNLIVLRQFAH